jgi:hypothetical protein
VTVATVLLNLLIAEAVPNEWEGEIRQNGSIPDPKDENDDLSFSVPVDASSGERRNQLPAYLLKIRN